METLGTDDYRIVCLLKCLGELTYGIIMAEALDKKDDVIRFRKIRVYLGRQLLEIKKEMHNVNQINTVP